MKPTLYDSFRWRGARIGLLGGSFNPAHDGHRQLSDLALRRLGLDCVWWLVTPQNPLKSSHNTADLAERVRTAERIAAHPRIVVTDLECKLGTRYTFDTVQRLNVHYPSSNFVWLMGADNFIQFPQWKRWNEIMSAVPVAVIARPRYHLASALSKAAHRYRSHRIKSTLARTLATSAPPAWILLFDCLHPASSTDLRNENASRD